MVSRHRAAAALLTAAVAVSGCALVPEEAGLEGAAKVGAGSAIGVAVGLAFGPVGAVTLVVNEAIVAEREAEARRARRARLEAACARRAHPACDALGLTPAE